MTPPPSQQISSQDAQTPDVASPEGALGPYLRAIRARLGVVALITAAAVAAAVALVSQRAREYEATAQMLVAPLPQSDTSFLGIQLLRDSGDPTRTVRTAATLIDSPEASRRTAMAIGSGYDAKRIRAAVTVGPVGESNLVGVTAKASDARLAARIANTFARVSLGLRRRSLQRQFELVIAGLGRSSAKADRREARTLRRVAARGDPTLTLSQLAQVPVDPTGSPDWLVVALALVAGLMLAVVAALLMERLDRRVRDSSDLLRAAPYPVLARVPRLPRGRSSTHPRDSPPDIREAFKTLAIQLDQRAIGPATTVVVTSPSSGDGKTTTALNLAFALVAAGRQVVLIDFDLRHPSVEARLGMPQSSDPVSLLTTDAGLAELLRPVPLVAPLRIVSGGNGQGDGSLLHAIAPRLKDVLKQAAALAEYVVIDTPPVGEVGDALMVASFADELILVGRAGATDRVAAELLPELLQRSGLEPSGWVLLGEDAAGRGYYSDDGGGVPSNERPRSRG